MSVPNVVLDTNVLVAALHSRRGASSKLLSLVGTGRFEIHLSVPLAVEYEDVLTRHRVSLNLTPDEVDDVMDALCAVAQKHEIYFLWRPYLRDVKDEMILELAIAAQCERIITFNKKDFAGIQEFGIRALTPKEFL